MAREATGVILARANSSSLRDSMEAIEALKVLRPDKNNDPHSLDPHHHHPIWLPHEFIAERLGH